MTGADGELVLSDVGPAPVRFMAATGCADYPEVELNVSGPHLSGPTPNGEVQGFVDTHLHVTAHEFLGGRVHCGRPWHPYGAPTALVDCRSEEHTSELQSLMRISYAVFCLK